MFLANSSDIQNGFVPLYSRIEEMLAIGKYNTLTILRDTKVGLFLGNPEKDPEGIHDVLLPNKYVPNEFEIGEELIVFVYLDHEERPVATTLAPYVLLNEFALLRVNYINQIGAFMDWGMEKDILVPFKEQARPMEKGKRYLVYLYMDEKTKRFGDKHYYELQFSNKGGLVMPIILEWTFADGSTQVDQHLVAPVL